MSEPPQSSGRRALQSGATGAVVAENLVRLRRIRGLTTRQLAVALQQNGRYIPASGITRMERGERHVTVDELVALAVALGVAPGAILLPLQDAPSEAINITGAGSVPADTAWAWVCNERPLELPQEGLDTAIREYELYGLPPGRRSALRSEITTRRPRCPAAE